MLSDRNISNIQSITLLEGIAGWAKAGKEYTQLMDGYDESVWEK